jgi:phosphoglycolate phosphatase-like HAD superfamily hydrolase
VDKVLLVDCDGVLVEWHNRFHESFPNKEQDDMDIHTFNSSPTFGELYAYKDSVDGIKQLKERGFTIVAITSSGTSPITKAFRRKNLDDLFGTDAINAIHVCELHGDKTPLLSRFKDKGYIWIEDSPHNAILAKDLGLSPLLINTPMNADKDDMGIQRVDSWKEIVRIVDGHYS